MDNILTTIETFVDKYLQIGLDFLDTLPIWLQGAIVLATGLFAIIGIFVFLKKFIKLFIVLAIIGGGIYFLWTQTDIIQNLIGHILAFGAKVSLFLK